MINMARVNLRIKHFPLTVTPLWIKTMAEVSIYVINRSVLTFDPNRTRRRIGIHVTLQRNRNAFPQRESKPRNTTDGE
jgi:hypothetical protein